MVWSAKCPVGLWGCQAVSESSQAAAIQLGPHFWGHRVFAIGSVPSQPRLG